MNRISETHILAFTLVIVFLVGGIFYYTINPEAVSVDPLTSARTTDFNLLTKENLKKKAVYYRVQYRYNITSVSGIKEREGEYYAVRAELATSTTSFQAEIPRIKEKVMMEFKRDNISPDRAVIEDSVQIFGVIKQLACDDTFDPENNILACYDGIDINPSFIGI